ncbi:hypothetical protein KR009_005810 [Drosophila setifemur]|nr:hypothetical protein KR009_005810 [Drosophila setifemur]
MVQNNWTALAMGDTQCGRLDERLMYTLDEKTEPSENPWIGILLEDKGNRYENTRCSVVIINSMHLLTTASCVKRFKNRFGNISGVAMLGVWDEDNSPDDDLQCNDKGFCVPGPKLYNLAEIRVHPESDKDTGDNDIAILRLVESIRFTNWVQPVCLQGSSEPPSLIHRNLHYSGFTHSDTRKGKGLAMTVSRQKCKSLTSASILPPENQLCGFPIKRTKFYPGTALMDIEVQNNKPHSFYVVALLVRSLDVGAATTQIYQDLRPSRSWILENSSLQS